MNYINKILEKLKKEEQEEQKKLEKKQEEKKIYLNKENNIIKKENVIQINIDDNNFFCESFIYYKLKSDRTLFKI